MIIDTKTIFDKISYFTFKQHSPKPTDISFFYEAVNLALTTNPDLIILDMMLPGLDGIEVCQEIRNKKATPIIFLSCKGDPLDKSMGLTSGGDDYMSKPFVAIELLARVKLSCVGTVCCKVQTTQITY